MFLCQLEVKILDFCIRIGFDVAKFICVDYDSGEVAGYYLLLKSINLDLIFPFFVNLDITTSDIDIYVLHPSSSYWFYYFSFLITWPSVNVDFGWMGWIWATMLR